MTETRIVLLARLEQAASSAEPDVLRDALRWAIEELMKADVTAQLGAAPMSGLPNGPGTATGTGCLPSTPAWARSSSRSRGPGRAREAWLACCTVADIMRGSQAIHGPRGPPWQGAATAAWATARNPDR